MKDHQILVVDSRSQTTLLFPRCLREMGVRAAVLDPKKAKNWLKTHKPRGIILSGGDGSVNDPAAPTPPPEILNLGIPILAVCFGMQWMAKAKGGKVESRQELREYGEKRISIDVDDPLFSGLDRLQVVWQSHGDSVTEVPPGSRIIANSMNTRGVVGFSDRQWKEWALQFHPEVIGTKNGKKMLENFVFNICGCEKDWQPTNMVEEIRAKLLTEIGDTGKAIIGFSAGVDSTTLATIASVLGKRLIRVCIDAGQLREGEVEEVKANAVHSGGEVIIVRARRRFQKALRGIVSLTKLRTVFSKLYVKIFEEVAKKHGATFLLQGTLAPDLIESGETGADVIKVHHNTGLKTWLKQIDPLAELFKYEVRELARILELPESVYNRKPFPGPGLFLRILGATVTPERLKLVRWATAEVDKILTAHGLMSQIDQVVVAFVNFKTTGVRGDKRSHGYPILVRTITSSDFMTARGFHLPEETERAIESAVTKHPKIVRLWTDATDKPTATVEFQ